MLSPTHRTAASLHPAQTPLWDITPVWYGFIGLLFALLLLGVLMTGHVVRRELDRARQQTDFLASVTHEFKTPITSIRLHMERLQSRRLRDAEAVDAYYETIGQQAHRLERLVNRMLEAHRIRAGSRRYHMVPCAPADLVMDSVAHLLPAAEARQIRVRVEPPGELPAIKVDQESMREALDNLIDNAIRYSPGDTEVRVGIEATGRDLKIQVEDQGIGIDPEDMPRLFDHFYRGKRGDRYNVQGTGLGLSLVKATALAHGGSVQVHSTPGQGSRFLLQIPLQRSGGERRTNE